MQQILGHEAVTEMMAEMKALVERVAALEVAVWNKGSVQPFPILDSGEDNAVDEMKELS